jgi:hypothetical protein
MTYFEKNLIFSGMKKARTKHIVLYELLKL